MALLCHCFDTNALLIAVKCYIPVRSSLVQFTDIKFKQLINEHITLLQVDIVNYRPWLVSKESVEFIIYIHCILGGVYQAQGHKILKLQCLLCQDNS